MKRFHVHVSVANLDSSIEFYSKLFNQKPTVEKIDYAKWMLEDPKVNFAISMRGKEAGVDHFGFQVENEEDLLGLKNLAESASNGQVSTQKETVCCYANSNKYWVTDPQGIAWEHFHSTKEELNFSSETASGQGNACCAPSSSSDENKKVLAKSGHCGSQTKASNGNACC